MTDKPEAAQEFIDEDEAEDLFTVSRRELFGFISGLKDSLPSDIHKELVSRVEALAVAAYRLARAKERSALRLLHPDKDEAGT